jgi:hypothetical protein
VRYTVTSEPIPIAHNGRMLPDRMRQARASARMMRGPRCANRDAPAGQGDGMVVETDDTFPVIGSANPEPPALANARCLGQGRPTPKTPAGPSIPRASSMTGGIRTER